MKEREFTIKTAQQATVERTYYIYAETESEAKNIWSEVSSYDADEEITFQEGAETIVSVDVED